MAAPAGLPEPQQWLTAYARVQKLADADLIRILKIADKDIRRMLRRFGVRGSIPLSQAVRQDQLSAVRRALLAEQAQVFRQMGDMVRKRRLEAAARAVQLGSAVNDVLFRAVGARSLADRLEKSMMKGLERTTEVAVARMTQSQIPLSERIYRTNVWMNGRLNDGINSALLRGLSATEFAAEAQDWFDPNTPGGVRYASMRLARTEINNAFHAVAVNNADEAPWIDFMKWHLSRSHPRLDLCDEYAHGGSRGGGVYLVREVPRKPHPHCFCYVTPVVPDEDEFLDRLVGGEFDDYLEGVLGPRAVDDIPRPRPAGRPKKAPESAAEPPPPPKNVLGGPDSPPARDFTHRPDIANARDMKELRDVFDAQYEAITGVNGQFADIVGGKYFTVSGVDLHIDHAKDIAEALLRGASAFPSAFIRSWGTYTEGRSVYAHALTDRKRIEFNTSMFGRRHKATVEGYMKHDVEEGFHPPNMDTPFGIALHEYAHILHMSYGDTFVANFRIGALFDPIDDIEGEIRKISRYAEQSIYETVAEAMADVWINGREAQQLSKKIYEIVVRTYRENGGK